jgi:hypothetical protein
LLSLESSLADLLNTREAFLAASCPEKDLSLGRGGRDEQFW